MQDLTPINIVIGDRSYRVRIEPKNEEVVRKTLKLVNDKIIEFKTGLAGKDMQDYIAMVLVWFATLEKSQETISLDDKELSDRLRTVENMLDKVLTAPVIPGLPVIPGADR